MSEASLALWQSDEFVGGAGGRIFWVYRRKVGEKNVYFQTTAELIEAIKPYVSEEALTVHCEDVDTGKGDPSLEDLVMIDELHRVGFRVSEHEVVVFCFTGHAHFEDCTSEPQEGQAGYVTRAKEFLSDLLQYRIRHVKVYRGRKLASEKYDLLYPDERGEDCFGGTRYGLLRRLNPFAKRTVESAVWQYDKEKGLFATRLPKRPDPEAVEVIDVDEDCYIEIFYRHHAYKYVIMRLSYDEYSGYYWSPFWDSFGSFYDTKEKAAQYAMEALKLHP